MHTGTPRESGARQQAPCRVSPSGPPLSAPAAAQQRSLRAQRRMPPLATRCPRPQPERRAQQRRERAAVRQPSAGCATAARLCATGRARVITRVITASPPRRYNGVARCNSDDVACCATSAVRRDAHPESVARSPSAASRRSAAWRKRGGAAARRRRREGACCMLDTRPTTPHGSCCPPPPHVTWRNAAASPL